jgi:ABC-type antimicrobial peptide transport system permease subunit
MGATSGQVGAMVIKEGAVLAGMGILAGAILAFGLTRLLASLLFNVHPLDPLTFGAVTTVVLIAVLMASYFPARRAASGDPMGAMRGG